MNDQAPTNPNNRPPGNNNSNNGHGRRHHNQRRRPHSGEGNNQGPKAVHPQQQPRPQQNPGPASAGQPQGQSQNSQNNRRRPNRNNHNRPRNPNPNPNQQGNHGINIERIYEKYLNLLDQHLIARRKYHDLFYRADQGQKHKLERNFYNTLNDIRDFESKLAPEARELFEKRNNGLRPDNIYTTNHEIPLIGDNPPPEGEWSDPHFLHSQKVADYSLDKEESMGSIDDYLKYKNLI